MDLYSESSVLLESLFERFDNLPKLLAKLSDNEVICEGDEIDTYVRDTIPIMTKIRRGCAQGPEFQSAIIDKKFHSAVVKNVENFVSVFARLDDSLEWLGDRFFWECLGTMCNSIINNEGGAYTLFNDVGAYQLARLFIVSSSRLSDVQLMLMLTLCRFQRVLPRLLSADCSVLLLVVLSLAAQDSAAPSSPTSSNPWSPPQHGFCALFIRHLACTPRPTPYPLTPIDSKNLPPQPTAAPASEDATSAPGGAPATDTAATVRAAMGAGVTYAQPEGVSPSVPAARSCLAHIVATTLSVPLDELKLLSMRMLEPEGHQGLNTAVAAFNKDAENRGRWLYARASAIAAGRRLVLGLILDVTSEIALEDDLVPGGCDAEETGVCMRCELMRVASLTIEAGVEELRKLAALPNYHSEVVNGAQTAIQQAVAEGIRSFATVDVSSRYLPSLEGVSGPWDWHNPTTLLPANEDRRTIYWRPESADAAACVSFAIRAAANLSATVKRSDTAECEGVTTVNARLAVQGLSLLRSLHAVRMQSAALDEKVLEKIGADLVDAIRASLPPLPSLPATAPASVPVKGGAEVSTSSPAGRVAWAYSHLGPSDVVRMLGNLMFRSSKAARLVGAVPESLKTLLACCRADQMDPLLKDAATVALRAATGWSEERVPNKAIMRALIEEDRAVEARGIALQDVTGGARRRDEEDI